MNTGSSWTPDPSIGHLLYTMRSVGPKMILDDQGVGTNMDEAEEDYEFLTHLLRRLVIITEIQESDIS